jgi:hypothetical protein
MLRTILMMAVLATGYAIFAMLFRNKRCSGNCGSCVGSCDTTGEKL